MNGRLRFLVVVCVGFLVWFSCSSGLVWASDGGRLIAFQNAPYAPPVIVSPVPAPPVTPTPVPEPEDPPASFEPYYTGGGEYTVSDSGTHGLLDAIGDVLVEIKRKVFAGASHIFEGVKWAKQFFDNALNWIGDWLNWWADYADGVVEWVGDWFVYAYGRALTIGDQIRYLMQQFSVFAKFISSLAQEIWKQFVLFAKSFIPWAFWRFVTLLLGCVLWTLVELVSWLPEYHLTISVPSFLQWVSVFLPIPWLLIYVSAVVYAAVLYLTLGAILRWAKVFR